MKSFSYRAAVYKNIFYFIFIISLFSFYEPQGTPQFSLWEDVLFIGGAHILFFLFCKGAFARFYKKYVDIPVHTEIFSTLHARLINTCTLIAIVIYGLFIYFFDFKYHVLAIPFIALSEFVLNCTGIVCFVTLLGIIWTSAFPSYRRFYDATATRKRYILSHLRLNVPIIVPWLIFSLVLDLMKFLPRSLFETLTRNTYASYGLFALFLCIIACFFPWMLVRLWNCRPLENTALRQGLEDFCSRSRFAFKDILLWNLFDGKLVTAGVLGFIQRFRYLLISPTLIEILDDEEIESVVAHEIGHIKSRHMIFYLLFILGYVVFAYAFFKIIYLATLSQDLFFSLLMQEDGTLKAGFYIVPTLVLITFLLIYFRFLFGAFSRNFERQADTYAIKLKGENTGIIGALDKIASVGSHSRTAPNWHHFSIQERITFLEDCEHDPGLVEKHDRKVIRMVAAYILALLVAGGLFYGWGDDVMEDSEMNLVQKVIEKRIAHEPENPILHFQLANIFFEKKLFKGAEKHYLITLTLTPYEPEALNNLAWLYATAADKTMRNPREALKLSRMAAQLRPKAHILDTLAESYFVNRHFAKAVETIERAIAKKPKNLSYYKKQLKKFRTELQKNMPDEHAIPAGGVSI